jgi:hypothetical protein
MPNFEDGESGGENQPPASKKPSFRNWALPLQSHVKCIRVCEIFEPSTSKFESPHHN